MSSDRTIVKRPILAGTSRRITFQIKDADTGDGFQPDTLVMSVYDVDFSVVPATETIVNSRNDVNVIGSVDAGGHVDVVLDPADTAVDVPGGKVPATLERRVLFVWTWDDDGDTRTMKHEIVLTIAPDREGDAA